MKTRMSSEELATGVVVIYHPSDTRWDGVFPADALPNHESSSPLYEAFCDIAIRHRAANQGDRQLESVLGLVYRALLDFAAVRQITFTFPERGSEQESDQATQPEMVGRCG